jgi:Alginate lyase
MKISAVVNRFSLLSVFGIAFSVAALPAAAQSLPRVFQLDAKVLAAQKTHPNADLLKLAQASANSALKLPPQTIVHKTKTPPSGDMHDYMSMARYWWPNPDTPNHLPYVRHDGKSNPEINGIEDHVELTRTDEAARSLALAWYFTGDERYAEHATLLLRSFFLNKETAMNPNLEYAQYVAGLNTGRDAGVLDARSLAMTVDAIGLLAGSKSWTAADQQGMQDWFTKYYVWLTTAKNAKKEAATPNNHGSWCAVQLTSIGMFLGKTDDVKKIAEQIREQRIPSQFDVQGMQKYELVRTNSFSYSSFNLEALTTVDEIVAPLGEDLYKPVTPGAPGILTGIDALLPYDPQHPWPHEQISKDLEGSLCPALVHASAHTHEAKYVEAQKRFACKQTAITMLESMSSR